MFGTSVFGVEKWGRGLMSILAVTAVAAGPVLADDDMLISDTFEGPLFAVDWAFEESPDPSVVMIPPQIVDGDLEGDQVVRFNAPGGNVGGGIPGGICQDHLTTVQEYVGLWADLRHLDLNSGAHFKLFNLSPDSVSSSIAGVRIREHQSGVFKMVAYADENDGTRINSVWATLPDAIVDTEPLFFRASWTVSSDAIQPNGSFVVEVFRADGSMLLSVSLAGLDTFGQSVSYPRFGMIEPFPHGGSSGYLDIDQIEVNKATPIPALPLGGFSSGSN